MSDTESDETRGRWFPYIEALMAIHGLNATQLTARIGAGSSAYTKWKQGGAPGTPTIVAIAREFSIPLQEVMLAAGVGTPELFDYRGEGSIVAQLERMPNEQLLELVRVRMVPDEDRGVIPQPVAPPAERQDMRRRISEPPKVARRRTKQ